MASLENSGQDGGASKVGGGSQKVINAAKPTMTHSLKSKYIVRSRHNELTSHGFLPVSSSQARNSVRKEFIHDAGMPRRLEFENTQRSTLMRQSLHGSSVFRNTSPVTQDHL